MEAEVHGRKKTLIQLLKQFHACFYWLYERDTAWAMVGVQGLHLGDASKHYIVSSSAGLMSFCPWCLKLGGTPKQLQSTQRGQLWDGNHDIYRLFSGMS